VDAEAFALALCRAVRGAILPMFGRPESRSRAGTAAGGDPTYAIDESAEELAARLFADRGNLAYFTEDAGLKVLGDPKVLYLLDPIDGTRPAVAGFETCCVTVAVAPFRDDLTIGDLTYGCIVEIPTGAVFEARRGGGATAHGRELAPAPTREPHGLFWGGGFRGQPAVALTTALEAIFDSPGSEGAYFDQNSAAYSMSRVATGQLDAFVDVGQAIVEEVPALEPAFRRLGGGHVLNTTTYDVAAGYLLLQEMGLPVTDARGRPVDEVPLFDDEGNATLVSTVAACTEELHEGLLRLVGEGLDRLADAHG
jgi:myo-inositol-1(or 4)-monophosphatase